MWGGFALDVVFWTVAAGAGTGVVRYIQWRRKAAKSSS
jgi:hypothetical protein